MLSSRKPWIYLITTVVIAAGFAVNASAGTTTSGAAPTREQNLDANGLIRTHEQGTALTHVTNFPLDGAGNLRVSGTVNIGNTPDVNAMQSGPWLVGQQGAWTVGLDPAASQLLNGIQAKLANFSFDNSGKLLVAAPATQTVAPTTFFCEGFVSIAANQDSSNGDCLPAPPAGKIFVIEDISADVTFKAGEPNRATSMTIQTTGSDGSVNSNLFIPMPTVDQQTATGGRQARAYGYGPSAGVCYLGLGSLAPSGATATCFASGYLINAT